MAIRTHLIAGFLGAGKTTTLLHLLRGLKARGERCAVLVNEFGSLGIDGTVLMDAPALCVREIPDGCICCTLAGRLLEALAEIADKVRPARLLIEPTGLARPGEIRRLLRDEAVANLFDLAPVLTIVNPATFLKLQGKAMPFYEGQVAEADVIVANKLDCLPPADLPRFREALARANPRARLIETTYGSVPADVLEGTACEDTDDSHGHAHGASLSFQRPAAVHFSLERLRRFFAELDAGVHGVRPWRAKGIFHTEDGCVLFNLSDSGVDERPGAGDPGESRCDLVAEALPAPARPKLEAAFEACVARDAGGAA